MFDEAIRLLLLEWIKLYKLRPLLTSTITIITMLGIGVTAYQAEKTQREQREAKRLENLSYSKQLESLNQVRSNLEGLLEFVDLQRAQLKQEEATLTTMKTEHETLKPLLETDKRVIDAIFAAQEMRNQQAQMTERWIGFGLGVLASLIASFVWAVATFFVRRGTSLDTTT